MKVSDYLPTEKLQPFVKVYKIIESENELVNRVLPGTSIALAFRYKGQVSYLTDDSRDILPASSISGLRKSVRIIQYLKNSATIVVLFKETGAKSFFKEPINELFEKSIPLDIMVKQDKIAIIEEQLSEAENNIQRIAIIEQFLLSRLSNLTPDKLVLAALEKIHSAKGIIKIRELSNLLFISNDAFEKRFRKMAGTSPKQFSSIIRMETIARQKQPIERLTDVAFSAGYYDQAHFNKDFKLFTGQTPKVFFKGSTFW